jgi:hypothetical protein
MLQVNIAHAYFPAGDPDLIAWYQFEGNADDISGNELHGTEVGDPTYEAGVYDLAINLDGDDDYVDCGSDPLFDITGEITVAAWLNIRAVSTAWQAAVAKGENAWRLSNVNMDPRFHFGVTWWDQPETYSVDGATAVGFDEWHHATGTYDGANVKIYLDGVLDGSAPTTVPIGISTTNMFIGLNPESTGTFWDGLIDDVAIYSRALTTEEIQAIMKGFTSPDLASNPIPEDEAADVSRDLILSWTPGETAQTHDVYLGTVFDDVNDADRNNPLDVLLIQNHDANTYEPGRLELGRMYYWRIDEVEAGDATIHTGDIWSFKVEPFAYPIENITVTASSSVEEK